MNSDPVKKNFSFRARGKTESGNKWSCNGRVENVTGGAEQAIVAADANIRETFGDTKYTVDQIDVKELRS